jgi:hypothetical protein
VQRALNPAHRHREAAFAAVAIQRYVTALVLDCFASLAMTAIPIERPMLWRCGIRAIVIRVVNSARDIQRMKFDDETQS